MTNPMPTTERLLRNQCKKYNLDYDTVIANPKLLEEAIAARKEINRTTDGKRDANIHIAGGKKPEAPTPINWKVQNQSIIETKLDATANGYIDRAMVQLEKVWENTYELTGATEEERDRQAHRQAMKQAKLHQIAKFCDQGSKLPGTPQQRCLKIIHGMIARKLIETLQLFLESLVKGVGRSAYFEYQRFTQGSAVNKDVAQANLDQLMKSLELAGKDPEDAGTFDTQFDLGEDSAPQEDYEGGDEEALNRIIATSFEDAESAALDVQSWCSAWWRLMTNNQKEDVLPFGVERINDTEYKSHTDFGAYVRFKQEDWKERQATKRLNALAALQAAARQTSELKDDFDI